MSALKFLPGILVLQLATAILLLAAGGNLAGHDWTTLALLGLALALLTALWFGSISDHAKKDATARALRTFAREREHLLVTAEVEKRAALEASHRQILKETNRIQARASLKLAVGMAGLMGIGVTMLMIEWMTFGLLVLAVSGGTLGGYVLRGRQETNRLRRQSATPPMINAQQIHVLDGPEMLASARQKSRPDA